MENKEIYIDGVDVSGCRHFKNDGIKNPICRSGGCKATYKSCLCAENTDCDYKQLKRAEQKLERIEKVCNKFIPDHFKILLIINGGIVEEENNG